MSAELRDRVVRRLREAGCVLAEEEADLLLEAARDADELEAMVRRRVVGEPVEYVVGWAEFCGIRMVVAPGVFVPRHRTELLVDEAERLLPSGRPLVVDLCCGSGALGAALAARRELELYAADVDPAAVRCARVNLAPAGGRVFTGDLFEALPSHLRGRVRVLLANVPYVPTDAIALLPPEARDHETRATLDGGPDGLDLMRRVSADAVQWLAPGGVVLFESSDQQVDAMSSALRSVGLEPRLVRSDDLGATVVTGRTQHTGG